MQTYDLLLVRDLMKKIAKYLNFIYLKFELVCKLFYFRPLLIKASAGIVLETTTCILDMQLGAIRTLDSHNQDSVFTLKCSSK